MERFKKLVNMLNLYEKSDSAEEESMLIQKNEILKSLSKSNRFNGVYTLIKENKLRLNHLILPYKVYIDGNDKKVFEIKTIDEFKEDYKIALEVLEEYYKSKTIDKETYIFLKSNFKEMKRSFAKEFCKTKLDRLNIKNRVNYELCLLNVNKKYHDYLDRIGTEAFMNICADYKKAKISDKKVYLLKQNDSLMEMFNLKDVDVLFLNDGMKEDINSNYYYMDNQEIDYCSFDVLTLEQMYKLKCVEFIRKNNSLNLIPVILEEIEFKKSNYEKKENEVKIQKEVRRKK